MVAVTETVHQFDGILGGPVLVLAGEELVLVDTGVPGCGPEILAVVASLGPPGSRLRHIYLTHADPDHIGSLPELSAATNARVYAHAVEARVIEGAESLRGAFVERPVDVDVIVADGDELPGGISVVGTPGHTLGHVSYFLRAERLLLAGDALSNTAGLRGSSPEYTLDLDAAAAAVGRLAALEPETICFGHGAPVMSGAAALLRELATTG
jgi:glyoxylase-like metal-dependent hydrolase (beta-lactamase superfamily II)